MTDRTYARPHHDPRFGRIVNHDDRSKAFRAIRPRLGVDLTTLRTKTWRRGAAYDQGETSQCVAYTGKGILNTADNSGRQPYTTRSRYSTQKFYDGAQARDEWDGASYDGTSALGLGRYLTETGVISEYRWNFGADEVLACLAFVGPTGIGAWWRAGMMETNADGFVRPTGVREGGHEFELVGINTTGRYVIGVNSWGTSWGVSGRFKMSYDDLATLLDDDGDSVVLVAA